MKGFPIHPVIAVTLAALILTACGGGGSNGEDDSFTAFSGFSNIPENGTVVINGQAVTADYVVDSGTGDITIVDQTGPSASTVELTTRDGIPVALDVTTEGSSVGFDTRSGDTRIVIPPITEYVSGDGEDFAVFVNPAEAGYEYQTYGTWITGYGTPSGTVGVGSVGLKTDASDIPAGTNATYSGVGLGVARRADNQPYDTVSQVIVTTDFNTASIISSDTQAININTAVASLAPELDFSGSGAVTGSGFVASVSGSGTSGSAQGQFYGPKASEVGGTFATAGSGGVRHIGAFGGN